MTRTWEAFWWFLFSIGGMAAAFLAPVMIFVVGLGGAGWPPIEEALTHENLSGILGQPLAKVLVFGAVAPMFFHCLHRIRHTIVDLGLGAPAPMAVVCYGAASVGTLICGSLLWKI